MKSKALFILLTTLVCAVAGCGTSRGSQAVNLTDTVSANKGDKNVTVAADTDVEVKDFSVRLFRESYQEEQDTLISPVSILYALGMTANGADSKTLSQMEAVFGTDISNLNRYLYQYEQELPNDESYRLSMANSIWLKDDENLEVKKEFLETNRAWYDADVYQAPFDGKTLENINAWVKNHTDGKIEQILDKIPEDAVLYLINALAFDAKWSETYEAHQVRESLFTKENGQKVTKEFLYGEEYQYLEDEQTTGFIKYYKGNKYAFVALLPKEGITMEEYVQSLSGEKLDALLENTESIPVDTSLPKFEAEYEVEMSDILSSMGMTDAFSPAEADFTRMATALHNIYIGRVLHKTNLKVSEEGTEAGAATVVEMLEECAAEEGPQERKTVYLDRPFVYLLIDCDEQLPIFIGTLMK